jgi:hypothetical protein
MNKKPYEAPVVKKVSLEIKNAVLGVCHTSTALDPMDGPCRLTTACFYGG